MSGTGERAEAVERHLGDRLAALIDGELSHEVRERVLAHLATCWDCRTEADAQRQVKSVFADTAPPPPPATLLARLQGLPADPGAWPDDDGRPPRGSARPTRSTGSLGLGFPTDGLLRHGGFRIHVPGRGGARGRRFAFAAAGAFSLAALALSGVLDGEGVTSDTIAAPAARSGPTTGPADLDASLDTAQRQSGDAPRPGSVPSGVDLARQPLTRGALVLRAESVTPLFGGLVSLTSPLLPSTPATTRATPTSVVHSSPSPTPLPSATPAGPPVVRGTTPAAADRTSRSTSPTTPAARGE